MEYLLFYLAVVAACLLWSATCVALATRTRRPWLRRLLVAVGWFVPPLTILPWVGLTGWCALLKFQTTWFGPTLTAFISALVGGLWIRWAGLSRDGSGVDPVAAGWPWPTLAVGCVVAKLVACGALLVISHAVAAQGRSLRVEAAQIMATVLSPAPAADDNAAPLYERALAAFEADATLRGDASPATNPLTADPTSPEATAILKRHAAALDLLRRATDRPSCRFDRDWLRPSIDMLLPEVQGMRTAARLLVLAARKAAADGDGTAALADVVRIHRIGMHAAAEPILVCGLVGQASDALALQALAAVLPRLDAKDLPRLETEPFRDFLETTITYRRHFLGEEAFGLATAADLADDRRRSMLMLIRSLQGPAPHSLPLDGPLSLLYRCFMLPADEAGYRAVMRSYRGLFENVAFSRPFPEVKQKIDEIQTGLEERRDGIFTALITPALGNVLTTQFRGRAMHATAQVLVAATRARLAAGTVPATLDALVPDWLPAVPRDPFTATAPLVSKRSDDAWVVYSVGPDGEDDGGPPPPGTSPATGNDDVGLWLAL